MFYSPEDWLRVVHLVAPEAFVTGSRAFGTGKDPSPSILGINEVEKGVSDTDVAVLVSHKEVVKKHLFGMFPISCEDSCYNSGFKFNTIYGTINIVPLHPLDFVCWKLTTKHMQDIINVCPDVKSRISQRETKLGIFEALTGIHKMLIPYGGKDICEDLAERI